MNELNSDEVKKVRELCHKIIKVFPKMFGDFDGWEYGNGSDAGKDFKSIYNKAKKLINE